MGLLTCIIKSTFFSQKSFLLIDDYTPFSITLSHGLNTNDLEMMETGATNTSTVMLNYAVYEALYLNQDVFFCVTFMKDDCDITMNCTQERCMCP